MWYRKIILAERGDLNLPFAKSEFGKLLNQALIFDGSNNVSIDFDKLNTLVTRNKYLRPFIKSVVENTDTPNADGYFTTGIKKLALSQIKSAVEIPKIISVFAHEVIHALDPGINAKNKAKSLVYPHQVNLSLSFEDNVKLQSIYNTAEGLTTFPDEVSKTNYLSSLFEMNPNILLSQFESWKSYYPKDIIGSMNIFNKWGIIINNESYKKENYEKYQAKYLPKKGKISDVKYFDDHIEPVAWRQQLDAEFSPNNLLRWFSKQRKINKSATPEKFIDYLKSQLFFPDEKAGTFGGINLLLYGVEDFSGKGIGSDHFYNKIKDEKIKRQILEAIGKNIAKAEILLKGGLIKLTNLEFMTLNPEYAEYVKRYLNGVPVKDRKKFYITQDINGNFKGNFQGINVPADSYVEQGRFVNFMKDTSGKKPPELKLPAVSRIFGVVPSVNVPETSKAIGYCHNPECKLFNVMDDGKYCNQCGEELSPTKKSITTPENATKVKQQNNATQKSLTSDEIKQKTSSLPDVDKISTPQSKSAISKVLPTIKKLFTALSAILDRFNNTKAGKVFNYGMLAKDVYFIITLTDKILEQIKNNEEVMRKDQLDLGLTIVSILTDQQTQAILRAIYPPIIALLDNPQVKAWMIGLNVGANVLMGAVSVADYFGTLSGTEQNVGALSGIQNVPGSAQALVMPVFELNNKYGEVYNALIDIEKGLSVPRAINKHIMKDASGGIEPYRLSLLYKFINNKNRILEFQKSSAFNKLPIANQLLYPNVNSAYAISSYKKAKDAQELARKQTRQQSYNRNFAPSGISSIPAQ
jgi:hypothetical protein